MTIHRTFRAAAVAVTLVVSSRPSALAGVSSLVATAVSSSGIDLRWSGPTQGWATFGVERSLSASTGFVRIATVERVLSYQDRGLASGRTYYYRVKDLRRGGTSNVASATTFGGITTTTFTTTTSTTSTTRAASTGPVANAGPDQFTQTLTTITLNGSGSYDSLGTITSYVWTFGDGAGASGVSVTHAYASPGTYTATLTVTDSIGLRASDTAVVSVANRPPVANAGPDQTANVGAAVTLNGSGSDLDGTITGYSWTFGDGASASGATATHVYANAGTYTATLRVTDDRGAQGTDTALVTMTGGTATGPLRWAKRLGSAALDVAYGVATDGSGNVVVTGRVEGVADLGTGTLCPAYSIFVAKYTSGGTPVWSRCLSGLGDGAGKAVAVDGGGNVFVTGYFFRTIDFGGGPLTSSGGPDIFLAKFSPAGAHLWSRRFGSPTISGGATESGNGIAIDGAGNVTFVGIFEGTADFGGGLFPAVAQNDIFVAKYSSAGAHLWSRHATSSAGYIYANGAAVDGSGNVVVTGSFYNNADVGGGPLAPAVGRGIWLAKYSAVGVHVWSKSFGGWTDAGNAVAVDGTGNIVMTGQFGYSVNFGSGTFFAAGNDIFVAKFTGAGAPVWSKSFGSGLDDAGNGVAVDSAGNVIITGAYGWGTDMGGGPLPSHGGYDVFVAKYSPVGTHIWSEGFGSDIGEQGQAVAVDGIGNVTSTGRFWSPIDFGAGPLVSAGSSDVFLYARLP